MSEKICFFIGHRGAPASLYPALLQEVERHIGLYGVRQFLVGHYGAFDRLSARAVLAAKKAHPGLALFLLLPYHPAERPVSLPAGFDGAYYPPGMERVPRRMAIARANRAAVDGASYLIAYAVHAASNARALTEYARRREARGLITVTALP